MEFCNLKLPNNNHYEGFVKKFSINNKKYIYRNGLGTMYIFSELNRYNFKHIGWWDNDQTNGLGICIYKNGDQYYGNFKNGKRCGWGKYISYDYKYEGEWRSDMMHGYGQYINNNGEVKNGHWKNDTFHDIIDSEVVSQLINIKNLGDNSRPILNNIYDLSLNEKFSEIAIGSIVEVKSINKIGFLLHTKSNGWCVVDFLDYPKMNLRAHDIKVILRP